MNSLPIDLQYAFNFVLIGLTAALGLLKREQDKRIESLALFLKELQSKVVEHAGNIARLGAQHDSVFERLDRIEAKLDRVLEDRS